MIPHLAQSDIVTEGYSTFWHFWTFFGQFGGSKGAPGGVSGGGWKKFFSLKDALYLDNSNDTSFSSIGRRDGKLFNFLTFLDIFWTFWGVKRVPRGGLRGWVKKFFSLKVAFYLDNSNDTTFSSIGHRDGKLFNFLTFWAIFWTFWGGQKGPQGESRGWVKK